MACKQTLSGRNFHTRCNKNSARNPYYPLVRADTGAGWHRGNRFSRYVRTDHCEIVVGHFQNLRAMIARFTPALLISAEPFDKHAGTIILMICVVK